MNDLLKVLDMSEMSKRQAILDLLDEETMEWFVDNDMHLADLAFRLRDEVLQEGNATNWQRAMDLVFITVNPPYKSEYKLSRWSAVTYWFSHVSKPIHWIIAALIAKEQE